MAPTRIEVPVQLLVEGNDHRNFFEALADHLGIKDVQIQNFGGVRELSRFLDGFVVMRDFATVQRIGIVRDAEASAASALQSVQRSLAEVELPVPDRVEAPSDGLPAVSVLVLPGDGKSGMLENILCDAFADTEEDLCIDEYFDCLGRRAGLSVRNPAKARVHAWLATRSQPHVSVGVAAKKGYWNLDDGPFSAIRSFLSALQR